MPERNLVIGGASVAGLVAALWYVLVPAEPAVATVSAAPMAIPAVTPGDGTGIAQVSTGTGALPAIARTEEDGKGWFPTDTMATAAARYHAMRDKRRFVDLAMKTGGGAHLAYVIVADMRCAPVSGKPGTIETQRRRLADSDKPTLVQKAVARRYEGCEGFESRPLGDLDMLPLVTTLLGASDPAARALRLNRENDPERIRREVAALLGEEDPLLVALLADAVPKIVLPPVRGGSTSEGSGGPARMASYAERAEEESAWELALCRLDIECRKDESPVWIQSCFNLGMCGEDFAEASARSRHPKRFEAVLERSQVVEKAIRDRNWRSLGF